MTKRHFAVLAITLILSACGGDDPYAVAPEAGAASAMLAALFDEHFERNLELNPIEASAIGDNRYNDRLAVSNSAEYRAAMLALDTEFLDRLRAIDRQELSEQEQLSYDIFERHRMMSLERNNYPFHLQPINQFYSMMNSFVRLGSGASYHPFETVKDYDDFLSRTEDFVANVDAAIENMKVGVGEGVVQPEVLMIKVVPQLESQLVDAAEESAFWMPIENMPDDVDAADRERLENAYRDAIENRIIPAYERLNNFIGDTYLAASRDTIGLGALPNGDAWYAYLVRYYTTTELTPDEIHAIGLAEVARIHEEMHGVMEAVGFEGTLAEFFEFVNTDEQFFFDDPEEMIRGYQAMADRVRVLARALFDVEPKTGFEVRRVEPFREQSASAASYESGTPDGTRPGVFYANAYNLKSRPKWNMETLFLHEAIPGHHFQISVQQENEELPKFRRFDGFTAFIEGWGLYSETLGKELGMFEDPYQYFGTLNYELWRAIRLVTDTGIHAKGWTRQEVIDYMLANSAVAETRAIQEAERFMAIPGQALAYKIGQLRIREIRDKAEARLGDRFDVVAFHRQVLKDGSMPLSMLEAKIDRWVDAQF